MITYTCIQNTHVRTYACKYTYVHSWLQSNTDQATERIEVAVGMMKVMRERIDVIKKAWEKSEKNYRIAVKSVVTSDSTS